MPHDGFGEICACAHAAECGAYRALTPGQRAAGLFPLNQAFSIGGTDLAWSASHGHRSVSLAQFCADVWPPNGTNYWTKRKDAVRHKWQLQNQLTNGKTFGLFENKLLMKRVYRCLDIPFVAPVYSALVPRAGPAAREAERAGWTTADAEGPGGAEGAMLRALNETRGRADERCLVQSHSYKSEVVACPASRPRPPARAGPSIDGPSNHSSSGHLALRGPFAPYSRCAMRHAISRLHHSGREGEVVLKPVSSTMSMGVRRSDRARAPSPSAVTEGRVHSACTRRAAQRGASTLEYGSRRVPCTLLAPVTLPPHHHPHLRSSPCGRGTGRGSCASTQAPSSCLQTSSEPCPRSGCSSRPRRL